MLTLYRKKYIYMVLPLALYFLSNIFSFITTEFVNFLVVLERASSETRRLFLVAAIPPRSEELSTYVSA